MIAYGAYARARLSPKFEQLGWEARAGDSATTKQLRTSLIGILSTLFTAVTGTRALVNLLYGGRRLARVSV